jgi:hypothetical protein
VIGAREHVSDDRWTVNAIGPFELTEYLGLAMIGVALAITAPLLTPRRVL